MTYQRIMRKNIDNLKLHACQLIFYMERNALLLSDIPYALKLYNRQLYLLKR